MRYSTQIKPISYLNSNKDDAYPTLNKDSSAIYFCSNRNYSFDIFKVELPSNKTLFANISDTATKAVVRDNVLSSDYDDKCPFIMENMMVFTSNRLGGFGGFDLYYSILPQGSSQMGPRPISHMEACSRSSALRVRLPVFSVPIFIFIPMQR